MTTAAEYLVHALHQAGTQMAGLARSNVRNLPLP
jgi:hypothetical protein